MKKFLIISIVLTTIFSGCRYKEGPMISFRSVYKRLQGYWEIVEFKSNGIDSVKYYNDSCGSKVLITDTDGNTSDEEFYIIFNYRQPNEFGSAMKFDDNKSIVYIDFGNWRPTILGPIGKGKSDWKILKLTMKEFKISTTFYNLNYSILFKKTTL